MSTQAEREAIEQALRLLMAAKRRDGERHLRSRKMRARLSASCHQLVTFRAPKVRPANWRPAVARWFARGKLTTAELSTLLGTWLFAHTAHNGSERFDK